MNRRVSAFFNVVPPVVWFVLAFLTASAALVSYFIALLVQGTPPPTDKHILIAPFLGAFFGFVSAWLFSHLRRKITYRIFDPIPRTKASVTGLFVAVAISVFVSWAATEFSFPKALKEHGGLFDMIFGAITVVGFWLTYDSILQTRRIITSFGDLYERMIKLVKETTADKDQPKLRYLAYTASIGFLALRKENWDKLRGALAELGERLDIVCLDDDDLKSWHNQYIGRWTARVDRGDHALTLDDTLAASKASKLVTDASSTTKRRMERMPGFYLIFNDVKAIVVAPFFIPFACGTPVDLKGKASKVQMLGFETTDRRIVDEVGELFEYYRNKVNEPLYFDSEAGDIAEISAKLHDKLAEWKVGAKGKFLRYRLIAEEEDPWVAILSHLKAKLGHHHNKDYKDYLQHAATDHTEAGTLFVRVPDQKSKDWIDNNNDCQEEIRHAMKKLKLHFKVEIVVNEQ